MWRVFGLFVNYLLPHEDVIMNYYTTLTLDTFPFITLHCVGDHLEEVAEMIVTKFGVSGEAVFLDLDGEFVSYA